MGAAGRGPRLHHAPGSDLGGPALGPGSTVPFRHKAGGGTSGAIFSLLGAVRAMRKSPQAPCVTAERGPRSANELRLW